MYDVIIIGAGASGLASALTAAQNGKTVLVIEKNEKAGKKMYITGKGRCNITNECEPDEFLKNVISNPKFLFSAINAFSPRDCIELFSANGCPLKTERGGRVFPMSDKSIDVINAMVQCCKHNGVEFHYGEKVLKILTDNDSVCGVKSDRREYSTRNVIIATGGRTYPLTGSTGDGYNFARQLGHTVTDTKPSLVGFETYENYCDIYGLTLKNITLNVNEKSGKKLFSELGEVSFTDRGVAGPLFLKASAYVNKFDVANLVFSIDLKPALSEEKLKNRFLREFAEIPNKTVKEVLYRLLPKEFIPHFLLAAKVRGQRLIAEVTDEILMQLVLTMKKYPVGVTGLRPIEEAIVTSGGVKVAEINPKTMESRVVKGLYFIGEVLDVDALTGGYNLQIALSTGVAAGRAVN